MKEDLLVSKYVQALYDIAYDKKDIESVSKSIFSFCNALHDNTELRSFIFSSSIPHDAKKNAIKEIFAKEFPEFFLNFVFVIIDKNRFLIFDELAASWEQIIKKMSKVRIAEITLAKEAGDKVRKGIESYLKKIDPASAFTTTYTVDPSLIGGFTVKLENFFYDNSLAGHLKKIKESFRKA